jgi:hypothetical protein
MYLFKEQKMVMIILWALALICFCLGIGFIGWFLVAMSIAVWLVAFVYHAITAR